MKASRKRGILPFLAMFCLILVTFTGCQMQEGTFNTSGYIEAVLDSNYKSESQMYMGYTGAKAAEAATNHTTTVNNAVVRFFEKHGINPSEAQNTALTEVFSSAYKLCVYTVKDQEKSADGFTVDVDFTPLTNFADISDQIDGMKEKAGDNAYDLGAGYIDNIVALCKSSLETPAYGSTQTQTIDILLSKNGELSLNRLLFNKIDQEILPL